MFGYHDLCTSYIHFLILKITGLDLCVLLVDRVTAIVFFYAFIIGTLLNVRTWRQKKASPNTLMLKLQRKNKENLPVAGRASHEST